VDSYAKEIVELALVAVLALYLTLRHLLPSLKKGTIPNPPSSATTPPDERVAALERSVGRLTERIDDWRAASKEEHGQLFGAVQETARLISHYEMERLKRERG